MSIVDDHYKGYWAYYDPVVARRKTKGSLNLVGRPVFRELPVYLIQTEAGRKIRSPVTALLPYFKPDKSFIGKVLS
jgi:hypothetical protein